MADPALSAVVVTPTTFGQIRKAVRHLRTQDRAGDLQLVVVAPSEGALDDARPGELAGFGAVDVVGVGPIPNVDLASAAGVHAARAPVVAFVEDHAFPQPGFVAGLVDAHAAGTAEVVMPTVLNANPRHPFSWCNLLLAYGWWANPAKAGPLQLCSGHNLSVRRELLASYGEGLVDHLGRGGDLIEDLRSRGARFALDGRARTAHVNPSTWSDTAALRFRAGRLYAHQRATGEGWSPVKRAAFAAGSPAIPALRLRRLLADELSRWPFAARRRELLPALAAALVADAAGQFAGVTRGPGDAVERLATFEMDRAEHLLPDDVPVLTDPDPAPAGDPARAADTAPTPDPAPAA